MDKEYFLPFTVYLPEIGIGSLYGTFLYFSVKSLKLVIDKKKYITFRKSAPNPLKMGVKFCYGTFLSIF
ncbi:unnamed protein product [Spodoptera exigua]|nr:unnamed protein product [Spodoptera exigua]